MDKSAALYCSYPALVGVAADFGGGVHEHNREITRKMESSHRPFLKKLFVIYDSSVIHY
jgi:hypothetical protein